MIGKCHHRRPYGKARGGYVPLAYEN